MRFILSIATLLAAPLASAHAAPNVLLIISDDVGLDASSCYSVGTQQAPMPNIAKLCAQGMVFEKATLYLTNQPM